MDAAERLEILWAVSPGTVVLGGVLCVLTALFMVLAAHTIVCHDGKGDSYDA